MAVQDEPEGIGLEPRKFGDDSDENALHPLLMERAGEMMVVDDEISVLRSQDHRDHMAPEELGPLVARLFEPRLSLGLDLAHPDGDLRGSQIVDIDRMQNGFAARNHRTSPS